MLSVTLTRHPVSTPTPPQRCPRLNVDPETMNTLPENRNDDMRIACAPGSEDALVEFVFSQLLAFADADEAQLRLQSEFHLSCEDALLALDRVPGGVIRAITGHPSNRPCRHRDPIAHIAFEKVWSELPRRHLFSTRRRSTGRWVAWFEELRRRINTGQQAGAGQPAAHPVVEPDGGDKPQPDAEGHPR